MVLAALSLTTPSYAEDGLTVDELNVTKVDQPLEKPAKKKKTSGHSRHRMADWISLSGEEMARALDVNWQEIAIRAGYPSIHASVLQDDDEALAFWLANGAWVDERSPAGDTAMAAALRHANEQAMLRLRLAGADLEEYGIEGQPLLIAAALRRQTGSMRLLLEFGLEPDVRSVFPVHKELIEQQVLKDLRNTLERDRELTPLMITVARGDVDSSLLLLQSGASVNCRSRVNKRYPINFAVTQGYLYLMQVLLGRNPGEEAEQRVQISLSRQRAELYRNGEVVDTTSVSTGRKGYATPTGSYVITNKHTSWTSTIYRVAMPYFMRLNCGAIGLHAGHVPGYPASHGCIRLPSSKARAFFSVLRVGDVVEIRQ